MVELLPCTASTIWILRDQSQLNQQNLAVWPETFFFLPTIYLQAPPADAKVAGKLTKFEKNQVYQAELLESIKARTGKTEVLPSLTSRPADVDPPAFVRAPLKFADAIQQTKAEAPASTPTPLPSVSATVTPPKPAAAAAADISDYLSSSFSTPFATKAAPAAPPAAVAPVEGGGRYLLLPFLAFLAIH